MNFLLAGILIGFGIAGIVTSFDSKASRWYDRILFFTALVALGLGLCPAPLSTVLGLIPLYSWMEGVSLITFLLTSYFAFFYGPMMPAMTEPVFRQ